MLRLVFLALLLQVAGLGPGDGRKDGRQGNEAYQEGDYQAAADHYRTGLAAADVAADAPTRYGLLNNLGAALLQAGDAEGATRAFTQAAEAAPAPADLSRTAYNLGNAALAGEDFEAAAEQFKRALLADPHNEDARFNYEYARRHLDEQDQQQQNQQGGDSQNDQQQNQEQQPGQNPDQQGQPGEDQDQQGQQEQQQDEGQPEDEPGQPQDGQQDDGSQPQQQAQQPQPDQLSQEQAERILQALEDDEEQLLRQVQKMDARPRKVEKDW